jgi:branched-chain amino acid aminotransferase
VWIFLNDCLVGENEALVSVFDRGFMYGDGVFETLRVYGGRAFQLHDHLGRLETSAGLVRILLPRTLSEIASDVDAVVGANELDDGVVRIAVSRGVGLRGPSIDGAVRPTYVVSAGPLPGDLDDRRRRGIALAVVGTRRVSGRALPSAAKHANYLNSILAHTEAVESGADEALLLAGSGEIAECSGANVFLVEESRVLTPHLDAGILPGCARASVLDLCHRHGIPAGEQRLEPEALDRAHEVFVTNSVVEILPVRSIGDRRFAVPGPVTGRLMDLYRSDLVSRGLGARGRREF